jgi:uncharacterized protein YecE (DUF72 family)
MWCGAIPANEAARVIEKSLPNGNQIVDLATMTAEIRVGTSGYSFADWVGVFYPETIARGKMLDFYVQHFDTVEINSTYYRIPHAKVFENLDKKTKADFHFLVKAHNSATHERNKMEEETPSYLEAIQPLVESGKLRGILTQFPWSFKKSPENVDHLKRVRDLLGEHPLYVEFRHSSWTNEEMFQFLRDNGIGYVSVDEPKLRGMVDNMAVATTSVGYIRLHGRNAEQWWQGGPLRYDYTYSDDELHEWIGKVHTLQGHTDLIYLFFNNCHQGQAVSNARRILELLNVSDN